MFRGSAHLSSTPGLPHPLLEGSTLGLCRKCRIKPAMARTKTRQRWEEHAAYRFQGRGGGGGGEITRPSAGVDAWAESMRGARTSSLIPPRVGTRFLDEHRPTCSKRQRKRGVSAHGELGVAVRCRGRGQSHGENRGAIAVRRGHGRSAEHLRWARRPRAASWMQRKADSREPWLRPCEKAKRDRVS